MDVDGEPEKEIGIQMMKVNTVNISIAAILRSSSLVILITFNLYFCASVSMCECMCITLMQVPVEARRER